MIIDSHMYMYMYVQSQVYAYTLYMYRIAGRKKLLREKTCRILSQLYRWV